jgi:hypothetical protein
MAVRLPSNITIQSQYTIGKEYIDIKTNKEYQGYYYEINGKTFAGKVFNVLAPELRKITIFDLQNPFLKKASSFLYGTLSKVKLNNTVASGKTFTFTDEEMIQGYKTRYFAKKLNETPILIREISKEEFKILKTNPIYQLAQIDYKLNNNNDLNKYDQIMPGLGGFLSKNVINTSSANDN